MLSKSTGQFVATIFLSYSSDDRGAVEKLVQCLEASGQRVWWDRHISGGSVYSRVIETEIEKSKAVVVLWSKNAVLSEWVADEADLGRTLGKLIPISFDGAPPPLGFRQYQTIDFDGWRGSRDTPEFRSLIEAIEKLSAGADVGGGVAQSDIPIRRAKSSIAVLPFVNMSSDPEQDYFSDGLSEELLNLLARTESLHVAARTSSFQFKGQNKDIVEVGKALSVGHVLEGSVRKAGSQVRVTAQLIDAVTGYHKWSETYDRQLVDIFAIQDEISAAIVDALLGHLIEDREAPVAHRSENLEAYDYYLLGQQRLHERTRSSLEQAQTFFSQSVELDHRFAPSLAALAETHCLLSNAPGCYGDIAVSRARATALPLLRKAIECDSDSVEALTVFGIYHLLGEAYDEAIDATKRAQELNPNSARALTVLMLATTQSGDSHFSAMELKERIVRLDPLSVAGQSNLAMEYYLRGRFDEARDIVESVQGAEPSSPTLQRRLIWLDIHKGQYADALARLRAYCDKVDVSESDFREQAVCLLTLLGEGVQVEQWNPKLSLSYYLAIGKTEDAVRVLDLIPADGFQDYASKVSLALKLAKDEKYDQALTLIAPYEEKDSDHWGPLFNLEYELVGALLAIYLRHKTNNEGSASELLQKLKVLHRRLEASPFGVHVVTHRIGAFIAIMESDFDRASACVKKQLDYSVHSSLEFLGHPWFNALANVQEVSNFRERIAHHLDAQRQLAIERSLI